MIDTARYNVIDYGLFILRLVRRLTFVDGTGLLADWRVRCEAPSLITEHLPSVPEPEFVRRLHSRRTLKR